MIARFETGGIRHTFVTGFEAGSETSDPTRPKLQCSDHEFAFTRSEPKLDRRSGNFVQRYGHAVSTGVYAVDTAKLGRHWELTGGVRFDRFSNDYIHANSALLVLPPRGFESRRGAGPFL